jgi:phosphopantothenoylcysteine decarboxylase
MNTMMWDHPLTAQHIHVLTQLLRYRCIPPISKRLVCGDTGKFCVSCKRWILMSCIGIGAMAETETITNIIKEWLLQQGK